MRKIILTLVVAMGGTLFLLNAANKARYRMLSKADSGPVEILVVGDQPFPVRAIDPVLLVGKESCAQYRWLEDPNSIAFTCPEVERLADNAPMAVDYAGDENARVQVGVFNRPRN